MSATTSPILLDSLIVNELIGQLGRASVEELLRLWSRDMPPRALDLAECRMRGDVSGVAAQAHAIKGSSAMLGFRAVAEQCADIEATAKSGCMPGIDKINRLDELIAQSLQVNLSSDPA